MELDINDFSSFFELLTGFYIYLGLSTNLHDSLNINTWVKSFINETQKPNINKVVQKSIFINFKDFQNSKIELKSLIDNFHFSGKNILKLFKSLLLLLSKSRKKNHHPTYLNDYIKYERLEVMMFRYEDEKTYFNDFQPTDLKLLSGGFLTIINPIYLYFGILNFHILIFSGFIGKWDKDFTFQYFNLVSIFFLIIFFFQLINLMIRKRLILSFLSKRRNIMIIHVVLFIFTISYILICPLNHSILTINTISNLKNLNVFLCVMLPLLPIIIHIYYLYRMVFLQNRFKKKYLKIEYIQKVQESKTIQSY